MLSAPLSSEAFAAAVSRVGHFRGRPVVVKLGGSAMEDPAATEACLRSVVTLQHLGLQVVLVHGGGKPIDRAMAEAGLTPKKVAGRRYTDNTTLEIVVRVLLELNVGLVKRIQSFGGRAFGYATPYLFPLHGEQLTLSSSDGQPVDLGRVGKVTRIERETLETQFMETFGRTPKTPVIPSLALDADGRALNVNADTAAAAVAGAMEADKAIFLTDTPGVLRDRREPKSLIPRLTEAECRELIASGGIDGGMVPKVEACFEALEAGAKAALILDGRVPYSLLDVFLHDTFTGTEITK
jgi:acetylglutamate kinase